MAILKKASIKPLYFNKRVGFNKSAIPLRRRSESEINDLAILALESNDQSLLKLFDTLPALPDLKKTKTEAQLKKIAPAVVEKREAQGSKPGPKKTKEKAE